MNHHPAGAPLDKRTTLIKILLLEDSDIDTELLAAHLTKAELTFEIERVTARDDFLAAIKEGTYDIILADYALPTFDGLSALAMAQQMRPEIPFILVSGMQGEEFATGALKRGATDYVMKRNLSRLATSIQRALAEATLRAARAKVEREIRDLNARLGELVHERTAERDRIWRLSRDLFAIVSNAGTFIATNPAWTRVLGLDDTDIIGRDFSAFAHPDDLTPTHRFLSSLAQGSPTERCEIRMRRADGDYRWISWTAVADQDSFCAVGRDNTEEKDAAARLEAANESLKSEMRERERVEATVRQLQRLEAVGQLTSGVAHDFNNLLTIIIGNAHFLDKRLKALAGLEARDQQRVSHIREAADRGAKLTSQLLAFSRRQTLVPQQIDINEAVSNMGDLLRSVTGRRVNLNIKLAADLWPALVDPTQVEMIVLNLAINARDAMKAGGSLNITTANVQIMSLPRRPEEPAPGAYVCLEVADNGTGMSDEVLAKVFEPFFTTKGPGGGSGLGLSQVYGSAKQSGGGVRIDTRLGEGSAIRVYFPRSAAAREPQGHVPPAEIVARGSGKRVLVVDDEPQVRELTASMIEELGHTVERAASGAEALSILRKVDVDVLVADYAMPEMNGVDLIFVARTCRPHLPALLITGYADLAASKALGEEFVLQKPCTLAELARRLDLVLKAEEASTAEVVPFTPRRA